MIKTNTSMDRLMKVRTSFNFHQSDSVVFTGTTWCIRTRHYDYGQPRESSAKFLENINRGALNQWVSHMSKAYDIEVEPERVQLFSFIEVQYEGPEDLDEDEKSVYEDYRTIFGSVTKKWVEETLLYPLDNAITG